MNLNGVEYYYIRNAQGDIIGLFDNSGTVVVSYIYDSWGKLISINGALKDTVGVKNPYRYRGYRYDSETELYYLNSRYYNPEWGRYINTDAYGGQAGELLSHNVFAYCMNNPVNMSDPSGYLSKWIRNIANKAVEAVKSTISYMDNVVNRVKSEVKSIVTNVSNSLSSSGYIKSAGKGAISGSIDKIGEVAGGTFIKEKRVWQSLEALTLSKYASNLGKGARFGKKALGVAGTAGFALWDVGKDLKQGEYYSATVDIASALGGFAAGAAFTAFVGAFAVPAGVAGLVVFGFSVGAGVAIDKYATYKKDVYYGR